MEGIFTKNKKGRGEKEQFYHNSSTAVRSGIEIIEDDSEARELQHKTILGKTRQIDQRPPFCIQPLSRACNILFNRQEDWHNNFGSPSGNISCSSEGL